MEKETFVGSCSKYIDGQGWTTEIPVKELNAKGYYKADCNEIKREIAQTFAMAEYVDGKQGLLEAVRKFINTYVK